jgi:hypothetical protein
MIPAHVTQNVKQTCHNSLTFGWWGRGGALTNVDMVFGHT